MLQIYSPLMQSAPPLRVSVLVLEDNLIYIYNLISPISSFFQQKEENGRLETRPQVEDAAAVAEGFQEHYSQDLHEHEHGVEHDAR